MTKAKFLFALLLGIFLLPLVAADANLNITSISFPSTVTHGTSNTLTFVLQNLNSTNLTSNVNYTIITDWNTTTTAASNISNLSSSSIIFSVPVPQYTVSSVYTGTIIARGTVEGGIASTDTRTFSINVTNSPALTVTWITSPLDVYQTQNTSAVVNVSNSGNIDLSTVSINVTDSNATYSSTAVALARGQSNLWTLNITTTKKTNYGGNTITVNAKGSDATALLNASTPSSASFNVLYRYCGVNISDERININEITNREDIEGETFAPLDKLTVKLKINNNYDEDRIAVISAVLVRKTSTVDGTEVEKSFEIKDDTQKSAELNFTIPIDADEGNYYLYVKAYDDDSSKYCDQDYIPFMIEKASSHKIEIYGLTVSPANISCEGMFTVSGKLGNTGSNDEDRVKLVYSDAWTSYTQTFTDVLTGDALDFSFSGAVPKNATEGAASFTLGLSYYYDEDDNDYNRIETEAFSKLNIYGNCLKTSINSSISTDLPTVQVFTGTQSEVKVLVSNTGTSKQTYSVEVPTVSWATINSVSPTSFDLESGTARYVSVKLTPNSNATGSQSMDVKVSYAGTTQTKTVSLNVQKVSQVSNLIDRVKFSLSRDWIWYAVGVLAAFVVVLIFAISSSSKKIAAVKSAMKDSKIKQYKNY